MAFDLAPDCRGQDYLREVLQQIEAAQLVQVNDRTGVAHHR